MAAMYPSSYPPPLPAPLLETLITATHDYQINVGSLIKILPPQHHPQHLPNQPKNQTGSNPPPPQAHPIGCSIFPTPFPARCFHHATSLQILYNKLYARVACDEEWLYSVLNRLIEVDHFIAILWAIHIAVKREADGYVQHLSLGVFRSDYMLQAPTSDDTQGHPQIKQVEFNTYSCAGAAHAQKVNEMQHSLAAAQMYDIGASSRIDPTHLPVSNAAEGIAAAVLQAHDLYGSARVARRTAVLFLVQPRNVNVCDERPVEYAMRKMQPGVVVKRVTLGEVLEKTLLKEGRELVYEEGEGREGVEISVVYMRAGYAEVEYDDVGAEARWRIEVSRAVKAPSLLAHLSTLKVVQQALTGKGVMERWLTREEAERVGQTFVPMYLLDDSKKGVQAKTLALDSVVASNFVLKPSREGGGHNVHGSDIPDFLKTLPESMWSSYVLMEKIVPPASRNLLSTPSGKYEGPVVSELGVFGVCLWQADSDSANNRGTERGPEMLLNEQVGFTFKTKPTHVDEMSVIKGWGCFDTPYLVVDDA